MSAAAAGRKLGREWPGPNACSLDQRISTWGCRCVPAVSTHSSPLSPSRVLWQRSPRTPAGDPARGRAAAVACAVCRSWWREPQLEHPIENVGIEKVPQVARIDPRPDLGPGVHQPLRGQDSDRLAIRRTRDREFLGGVDFAAEQVARPMSRHGVLSNPGDARIIRILWRSWRKSYVDRIARMLWL